ncbi:hypothetical protein [Pseudomonas sp. GM17]|uniref:hypothetical protein n=1 Tax=Pseudomonas sp. GM17 TaxID=1144323 RepID=UPI0002722B3B|nr:hypothetical protein [Pseudomonas sp. GM17]WIE48704.1 hypothetical protein PMI20_023590 [Pseudomonas sp. GM17]
MLPIKPALRLTSKNALFIALGVILPLLIFNLWFFLQLAIEKKEVPRLHELAVSSFTSGSSALIGVLIAAYLAYRYNTLIESQKREDAEVRALRKAIFCIAIKLNKIVDIYNNYLKENESNEHRWARAPGAGPIALNILEIDFNELGFLHEEHGRTLLELSVAEESYIAAINAINERSRLVSEKLEPAQKKAQEKFNTQRTAGSANQLGYKNLKEYVDDDIYQIMSKATDSYYRVFQSTVEKYTAIQPQILELAQQRFPYIKFMDHQKILADLNAAMHAQP